MALGLQRQIQELKKLLEEDNRFLDIAIQFQVHETIGNKTVPTAVMSPIYGGKWDSWAGTYIGKADSIHVLPCSERQFELVISDKPRVEGNGGRGSGKSEGGVLRALRMVCERPGEKGQIVSPIFKLTKIVWFKLLAQIPGEWLLPGRMGIKRADRELYFINGSEIRFSSSDNPDSLRSWGGGWTFVDEEQDVPDEALDIIWPSLRLSSEPSLWTVGTPKPGVYAERHNRLLEDEDATCLRFDSYSNPFIDHKVFEIAKKQMDDKTYRQEILAEWVFDEDLALVAHPFKREKHCIEKVEGLGKDITAEVTQRRCKFARKYIAGVDYNWNWPNYAVLYKIFSANPNVWVAVDVISSKGHAGHLGKAIKESGYNPRDILVVDDASGQYNKGKNSSTRLLRAQMFRVVHPKKNPDIPDRVNAFLSRIAPAEGSITWKCLLPQCEELAESLENLEWKVDGKRLDKDKGFDHCFDAATYPIHFFSPTMKSLIPRVRGLPKYGQL